MGGGAATPPYPTLPNLWQQQPSPPLHFATLHWLLSTRVSVPSSELGPPMQPLPRKRVCPKGGGAALPCGWGGGGPSSDDWQESLALCLLHGVTKRCRLSCLTNSALLCGEKGELRGLSQWVQIHMSPNKLFRFNSIFNLWFALWWAFSMRQCLCPCRTGQQGMRRRRMGSKEPGAQTENCSSPILPGKYNQMC
jgi:hypothetical protein